MNESCITNYKSSTLTMVTNERCSVVQYPVTGGFDLPRKSSKTSLKSGM